MKTGDLVHVVTRIYPSGHLYAKVFETKEEADAWVEEHKECEGKAVFVTTPAAVLAAPRV